MSNLNDCLKKSSTEYEADLNFHARRRQIIAEILFCLDLTPLEKLLGTAIEYSSNKKTGSTFEGYSSFARRLHLKLRVIESTAASLAAKGRLKIEHYRDKPHLQLVAKGDAAYRSTSGDKNFYAKRGAFSEAILGFDLAPYERIAYIGIAALTDPATGYCNEGGARVAGKIGISKYAMTSAIKKLVKLGVAKSVEVDGLPSNLMVYDPRKANPATRSATQPATAKTITLASSNSYAATTGSTGTIPYPTDTDRAASQRGHADQVEATMNRFCALVDLLAGDYGRHDERQTMGGIIKISRDYDWVCGENFSPDEVAAWIRWGLLARDGKWISITQTGWDGYSGYTGTVQQAA